MVRRATPNQPGEANLIELSVARFGPRACMPLGRHQRATRRKDTLGQGKCTRGQDPAFIEADQNQLDAERPLRLAPQGGLNRGPGLGARPCRQYTSLHFSPGFGILGLVDIKAE